jgi:prevent-host-death family protein
MKWQLQTAKAKLSVVFCRARTEGPQIITVRGAEGFVLLRKTEWDEATASRAPKTWEEFVAPVRALGGVELELPRRALDDDRPSPFSDDPDKDQAWP